MEAVQTKTKAKTLTANEVSLRDLVYSSVNKKLILQGISWKSYEQLLKEFEDSNGLHSAFDNGFLEIEMPTPKHEKPNRKLSDLVTTICVEHGIDFDNAGSTTLRRKVKAKGIEPDTCFYIQNESQMCGKMKFDFQTDPPPDLVIEVDVTSPSLDKMPIYAALGVPEVWLYKGKSVVFQKLNAGKYEEIEHSLASQF